MMSWTTLCSPARPGDRKSPAIGTDTRSIFEQDYDRIVFSYPFRCLQDKTQVFPLAKTEFVHNRLTHSLEVSSVGRSLGKQAGRVIISRYPELPKKGFSEFEIGAIVASASLAHDIGNPPFGHSGEEAISEFFLHEPFGQSLRSYLNEREWEDLTHYEGNAQGFRLLTRENYQGLRLTYTTLSAFSKYPRESLLPQRDRSRKSQKKYGFFQSEKEKFRKVAESTGLLSLSGEAYCWTRHPLAFLVEAADDICYSIIDLEDGCNLGLVSIEETRDLLAPILGDRFSLAKFNRIDDRREKVSLLRALVIAELIEQSCTVFADHEKDMLNGKFDRSLTSIIPAAGLLQSIIEISVSKIYQSTPVLEKETAGFEVLSGLIHAWLQAIYDHHVSGGAVARKNATIINLFPESLKVLLRDDETSLYTIILSCLDHLTMMTDSLALETYRKIKGIALPGI